MLSKADSAGIDVLIDADAPPKTSLWRDNMRWRVIGLIILAAVLNYIARGSMANLAPLLKDQLHFGDREYSYITSAFQFSYMIMLPLCGLVLDRLGTRFGFALFATLWSVSNMLHGFATGWLSLAFFRMLLGMSEAAVIPAGVKVSSEWLPPEERAVGIGLLNVGTALGNALAGVVTVWTAARQGWEAAFFVTGGMGLIWAAYWAWRYRAPGAQPALSTAERARIGPSAHKPRIKFSLAAIATLFAGRQFWTIAVPRFLAEPAWATLTFWVPIFLHARFHIEIKTIVLFAWMPFIAADLGGIFGGFISPVLMRWRGMGLVQSRVGGICIAACFMLVPGFMGFATSPAVAVALLCVGGFAHQAISALINTLTADCYPSETLGMSNGFVNQMGWLGGALFTLLIGQVVGRVGFGPLFAAISVFDVIGAAIFVIGRRALIKAHAAQHEAVA